MKIRITFFWALFMLGMSGANGQELVESIAAIVGNEVVYLSDVEGALMERKQERDPTPSDILRCRIFEDILVQKLFLDQARIDSITANPE